MVCHVARAHAILWRAWLSCNSLADRRPGAAEVGGRSCDNLFSNFWPRLRSAHCSRFQARWHSQRPSPSATRNTRPARPPSGRRTRPRRSSSPLAEPSGAIRFTTCITDARTVITISASPHNLAPVTPPRSFRTDCAFCRSPRSNFAALPQPHARPSAALDAALGLGVCVKIEAACFREIHPGHRNPPPAPLGAGNACRPVP